MQWLGDGIAGMVQGSRMMNKLLNSASQEEQYITQSESQDMTFAGTWHFDRYIREGAPPVPEFGAALAAA